MPVIPSDTVRIDERPDADSAEVQARIEVATDGVDHANDPTRRAGERADEVEPVVETATATRRRRADQPPDAA